MAWDEWEQLKAEASQGHSAQMQLNQGPTGTSSGGEPTGGDRLKHVTKQWNTAASTADSLRTSTHQGMGRLSEAHAGVPAGTRGLESADTLRTVLTSWEKRLESIRDECGSLGPKLRQAAKSLGETNVKVKSSVDRVEVPDVSKGR
ncbi:amino acid ABC transporter permease [Streptomyces parvus]|uniref:amino acid ABC transporter permease n=1 Tax=Streptomyces parvus TaxID=66428 RepID=UPI0033C793C4